jgi:MFS family permease
MTQQFVQRKNEVFATNLEKSSRKITATLVATQSLFSASFIMVFTVGSIIAVELAGGNSQWTGVPSTLVLVGAAVIAYPIGRFMDRAGRRPGLTIGYVFGILGTVVAGLAVINASLLIFLFGVLLIGLAKGVNDLGRYAAAEANVADKRARAISLIVLAGTVGSITGPGMIKWTGSLVERAGLPELSGPWFLAAVLLALSLLLVNFFLRPDPQQIARQLIAQEPISDRLSQAGRSFQEIIFSDHRAKIAVSAMVFGQLTMVWVMTITPVHMHGHHHDVADVSWVIMAHTMGMFGLSFLVGWLVDRVGRIKMITAGGVILIVSCILAPLSIEVFWLMLALFLLGLGWNCCFVAGSTLLADVLRPYEKGKIQGLADVVVNVASGVGSLGGGLVFAAIGYTTMNWIGLIVALIPLLLVLLLHSSRSRMSLEGTMSS